MQKKLILRKEHFGGILVDRAGSQHFLSPDEYTIEETRTRKAIADGAFAQVFDATELGYPLPLDASSSPMNIYMELTKNCNGGCTECFMNAHPFMKDPREMGFGDIEELIRQFAAYGGFYFRLTGGEPTVRADLFDIIDVLNAEGIHIGINTNGLFGESTLTKILSADIKDIRISLDGPRDVNDALRGKGSYAKVVSTLEGIRSYNRSSAEPAHQTINTVLMKSNVAYIPEMIALAEELEAKLSFGLLRLSGRAHADQMLSPAEIVAAIALTEGIRKRDGLGRGRIRINYDILCDDVEPVTAPYPFDNSKCPIGTSGITVDAYGHVVPCGYMVGFEHWIGEDVRGRDLLELWNSSGVMQESRAIVRPGCNGCEFHKVRCNGGCPVMAYVMEGDADGKDPYCVKEAAGKWISPK